MKTDTLDQTTDTELSEIFALERAGWTKNPSLASQKQFPWLAEGSFIEDDYGNGAEADFATSAEDVLPFLEKMEYVRIHYYAMRGEWQIGVTGYEEAAPIYTAFGPTLERAICIAIIRHKRATTKPAAC